MTGSGFAQEHDVLDPFNACFHLKVDCLRLAVNCRLVCGMEPILWPSTANSQHPVQVSTPPKHRYLSSTYSSNPYFEPSRPRPLSLMPPNGATSVEIMPSLMPTMPLSSASATRHTR